MMDLEKYSKELQILKKKHGAEGGSVNMCQAIMEMIEDGKNEGIFETLCFLVKDGFLQLEEVAKLLEVSESDFRNEWRKQDIRIV